jgi:hypothetical protein
MGLPGYCPRKGKRSTWGAAAYQNSIYARDNSYGASIFDFSSHAIGGKNFKVQGDLILQPNGGPYCVIAVRCVRVAADGCGRRTGKASTTRY